MRQCPPIALLVRLLLFATTAAGNPPKDPRPTGIVSHIKRQAVQSSAFASIGYSKRLHALEIEFRNGAIYRYLDIDSRTYRNLMSAPSKARFYNANIRRKHRSLHVRRRFE